MDLPDDNAAMVTHLSPSTHADVLSLIRLTGPVNDEVEEGDLTWCAAGLESLRSVTWDRVKEATCSDDDMRALEEIAADGFPESRTGMPVAIRNFHQYREDITSADGVVLYKDRVIIPPSLRVRNDQLPPRSLYDDLAPCVTMPALPVSPLPSSRVCSPVTPVVESGPTPPPTHPPAGSPRRGLRPVSLMPAVPARDIPCTPPPDSVAPLAPSPPAASPATELRRSTRKAGVPAWHGDYVLE
uniref:Uncharacterized protein n=1 Tax=Knipowitschia caucasica TaxID=637954 RepID=A0AAV2KGE8_KNICA